MKPEDALKSYILKLEDDLVILVKNNKNNLAKDVLGFCFAKSKRIRPLFTFACAKTLDCAINNDIQNTALALELLHGATLIHDDVIDESITRREQSSFYAKFGSKKAVIIGDYLLSLCFEVLSKINNPKVLEIFSGNILKTINGEINQFSNNFKYQDEDAYLEKSAAKTANLFICAAQTVCTLCNTTDDKKRALENFAYNFGLAFQIQNDIENFKNNKEDIKNGTYTLPLIYFKQENPTCAIMDITSEQIIKYTDMAQNKADEIKQKAKEYLQSHFYDKAYPLIRLF